MEEQSRELYFAESFKVTSVAVREGEAMPGNPSLTPVRVKAVSPDASIHFDVQGKFAPFVGEILEIRIEREVAQPAALADSAPPE